MKVLAICFDCDEEMDITAEYEANSGEAKKCECGGYVITPEGISLARFDFTEELDELEALEGIVEKAEQAVGKDQKVLGRWSYWTQKP